MKKRKDDYQDNYQETEYSKSDSESAEYVIVDDDDEEMDADTDMEYTEPEAESETEETETNEDEVEDAADDAEAEYEADEAEEADEASADDDDDEDVYHPRHGAPVSASQDAAMNARLFFSRYGRNIGIGLIIAALIGGAGYGIFFMLGHQSQLESYMLEKKLANEDKGSKTSEKKNKKKMKGQLADDYENDGNETIDGSLFPDASLEKKAQEDAAKKQQEEEAKQKAIAEAQAKAKEEEEKAKAAQAQAEAAKKAQEEAMKQAEATRKAMQEAEAQAKAQAKAQAEADAKAKAEAEARALENAKANAGADDAIRTGQSKSVADTLKHGNAYTDVQFTSSDDSVATVDSNGNVTARKAGVTTITMTGMVNGQLARSTMKIAVA